jgi:hypothetical protein
LTKIKKAPESQHDDDPAQHAGRLDLLCARHLITATGASQPRHIMVTDPNWVHSDGGWRPTATGLSAAAHAEHRRACLSSRRTAAPALKRSAPLMTETVGHSGGMAARACACPRGESGMRTSQLLTHLSSTSQPPNQRKKERWWRSRLLVWQ